MATSTNLVAGFGLDGEQIAGSDVRVNHDITAETTSIDARPGVIYTPGNPGRVAQLGTPARQVTVNAGRFIIKSRVTDGGAYRASLTAAVTLDVGTFHATLGRIDRVIVQIDDVGTSSTTATCYVLAGIPASVPVAPVPASTTAHYLVLADIAVPSAAARPAGTILTSDITDRRQYTTTTGGIIPVTNLAATTGLPIGTTYYDLANEQLGVIKAAGPRSPGGAPAVVQSAALNTSMWDVNWTDMRRLSQSLFSATFTRSGWAFVTAELDLQPDQNGWLAAYVRADIDGTPMVGSNRAAMYQNATTVDTQRRPYMLHVPTPVWFDAGVSRELCLAVSSFGTPPATTPGWWSPNTVQWTVAQV